MLSGGIHQVAGGGLAIGAGHPDHVELVAGMAVEGVGGGPHRRPRRAHQQLRQVEVEEALDHQRHCSCRLRLGGEVMAVDAEAGHAEVQCSRHGRSGVVGERGDLPRRTTPHLERPDRPDQVREFQAWRGG
jgi:hypothetical protein